MHNVKVAPIVILSVILTAFITLTIAGVVLLSLFHRGRYADTNPVSSRSRHRHRRNNASWMISPSSSTDSEANPAITISPSCPAFFGDMEKKRGVQVMITPPTPARGETASCLP
ncbi:hypothetical protein C0991_010946 [Blastosporella zonata]|nr:hypothetical protein C0991_010946 [Blastosporella zonata]